MSTANPQVQETLVPILTRDKILYIFSHSPFFYWWPVWAMGYLMALLTWLYGTRVTIGEHDYLFHTSKNLGVIFTFVFFLVILLTNLELRGLTSAIAILLAVITLLLLAYLEWWDVVLSWIGRLDIYMNLGFYAFFSTLVFLVWVVSTFIYDRTSYWRIVPGQITHEHLTGNAEKSFDTRGMVFEKICQDLFRHWILGLGSGDLKIVTMGARHEEIFIPNVLFVDYKVRRIQKLIAEHQEHFATPGAV
jgi:hypothetical protein